MGGFGLEGRLLRDVLDETIRSWDSHPDRSFARPSGRPKRESDTRPAGESSSARSVAAAPSLNPETRRRVLKAAKAATVRRAARRLGIDPSDLSFLAYALWGRTLAEERNSRADAMAPNQRSSASLRAYRGHATRQLLSELERHTGPYSVSAPLDL